MGNVLKYEIKKSRFMMLIVGIIIGGLELAYLIGFFGVTTAQNEKIQGQHRTIAKRSKI